MDREYRSGLIQPLIFIVEDDYVFKGRVMLSKINLDSIIILKNDFISLELIILERESTIEIKQMDNVNVLERSRGKSNSPKCLGNLTTSP